MNLKITSKSGSFRMSPKSILAGFTALAIFFLFASPFNLVSAYSKSSQAAATDATPATLAPSLTTIHPMTMLASPAKTVNCATKTGCVYVTDLSTDAVQIIQGTKYVGEISVSGISIGAAYAPKQESVYVAGYSCECVYVINAKTQVITTTISISEPGAGVAYSAKSGYIYAETFSAPGTYVVINPTTNKVVTTITACGYYPEFTDVNAKTGAVYAADRESSSGYGCVDEIVGTKIVATASLEYYGVGVVVNQKTGDVYVSLFEEAVVEIFTSSLKYERSISVADYLWGLWSNDKLQCVFAAAPDGIYPFCTNRNLHFIPTSSEADDGCGSGILDYAPMYSNETGTVAVIKGDKVITYVKTDGSAVFGCTATIPS